MGFATFCVPNSTPGSVFIAGGANDWFPDTESLGRSGVRGWPHSSGSTPARPEVRVCHGGPHSWACASCRPPLEAFLLAGLAAFKILKCLLFKFLAATFSYHFQHDSLPVYCLASHVPNAQTPPPNQSTWCTLFFLLKVFICEMWNLQAFKHVLFIRKKSAIHKSARKATEYILGRNFSTASFKYQSKFLSEHLISAWEPVLQAARL